MSDDVCGFPCVYRGSEHDGWSVPAGVRLLGATCSLPVGHRGYCKPAAELGAVPKEAIEGAGK